MGSMGGGGRLLSVVSGQRRRRRPGGALRSIKGTADLYIGRCDTYVSEDVIKKYIVEELGVSDCLSCKLLNDNNVVWFF